MSAEFVTFEFCGGCAGAGFQATPDRRLTWPGFCDHCGRHCSGAENDWLYRCLFLMSDRPVFGARV